MKRVDVPLRCPGCGADGLSRPLLDPLGAREVEAGNGPRDEWCDDCLNAEECWRP